MQLAKTKAFALLVAVAACGSDASSASTTTSTGAGGASSSVQGSSQSGAGGSGGQGPVFGGDRPVTLKVPAQYDPNSPAPLLILLHGYSFDGAQQNAYWGIEAAAMDRGMLFAHPDGTIDSMENRFWNATDACCNIDSSKVDDASYLRSLVAEIQAAYNVDPKRIYFTGHSNGSFMSYRMACDHADLIAGIAGLAGAMWSDTANCKPSEEVSVLHIHGTKDTIIDYEGGLVLGKPYPSAAESIAFWATVNGCSSTTEDGSPLDLDSKQEGSETTVQRYTDCQQGRGAELWTIVDGTHIPPVSEDWMPKMLDWLLAHPKP